MLPAAYRPTPRSENRQGLFVVLEGVSGIGKSTLTALLARRMNATSLHTLAGPHTGWSLEANEQLRALPQFAFYLSGLLHASDRVRQAVTIGPVVADRYASSVTACHAAVHDLDPVEVAVLMDPFRPYLIVPDATFYLACSEATLRERMARKLDIKHDDTDLFDVPNRYKQLLDNFEQVAAGDPTAVILPTDGRSPDQLADTIATHLEEAGA
ncbi:dTMP kinase [Streptomyces katsurahamanus]|uniref:Thymidylate kinase n=1 Tax=Streptomyces katsurahamanus TaxID=2577098 RepID=A0ABW9NU78_9ACTN|nr:thymidylate kinase [Streptomyces katsurahamanus]MQS36805.1 thymidylate kinase [Streptomyces katsurahamanus]